MVHKILFWAGFGVATRLVQLGIEMRPFFQRGSLWVFPLFASVGGSFGYWLKGVEDRQLKMLQQRKQIVIEKRRRRAEREGIEDTTLVEPASVLTISGEPGKVELES